MKNNILKTVILSCLFLNSFSQIKVINSGHVAIGINHPNHSLHVWGFSQIFNYNSKEIYFRPNTGVTTNNASIIASNLGKIEFWHPGWGWNTIKVGACTPMSDLRLKRDVTDATNLLGTVRQLSPKKFKYLDTVIPGNKFHFGFIAQEVAAIVPELVDTSSQGFLSLNYDGLIPFLVGAIKEQQEIIDSLRTPPTEGRSANNESQTQDLLQQIQDLKNQINYIQSNCCQTQNLPEKNSTKSDIAVANILTSNDMLLQNIPNPFDNSTTIKYKVPENLNGKFFIKIFDLKGEEKLTYEINKVETQIIITPSVLVSGMYLYSLIANNDILATKQMIISK